MQKIDWSPAKARSPAMLGALIESARPVIVAGCITDHADEAMVLDFYVTVCERHPNALFILAPLHPEVSERMQFCVPTSSIEDGWLSFDPHWPMRLLTPKPLACFWTRWAKLCDFYAAATIAHVNVDHNVLELRGFSKPVTAGPDWNTTYPSYPVCRLLMDGSYAP